MDNRKASQRQERRIADTFTGAGLKTRPTLNSGAFWTDPGDVRNEMFLIEAKTRNQGRAGAKSYTIKKAVWEKISSEAFLKGGRIPIYAFSFDNLTDLVILDAIDFANILKRMLDAEAELEQVQGDVENGGGN